MRLEWRPRAWVIAGALSLLPGCGAAPADPNAAPAVAPVSVESAAILTRQQTLSAFGTIEIAADHSRTLTLPYDCVVIALRAAPGQTLRAGAPILEVRPAPAAALEQRRAAEALRFARGDMARIQRLRTQSLATNADLAGATQALAVAEAQVSELGAGGARVVVAPIAGLVLALGAEPGAVIAAGTPLARVGDAHLLQARLGVEIEDLSNVREGAATTVTDLQRRQSAEGRVVRILRRVDPTTRLAEVTATLPPNAQCLPGAPVRAQIAIGAMRGVITISRAALVYVGDAPSVFVEKAGVARRTSVTVGAEFADRIEVLTGLDAGAHVIVDGAATLEDGAHVSIHATTRP